MFRNGPNKRKTGFGSHVVAKEDNKHLTSPEDNIIKPLTLIAAVMSGSFGVSPTKLGRSHKIPDALKRAAALQIILMQVNGQAEVPESKILATTNACVIHTQREGKFSHKYLYNVAWATYLEIMNPVKAKRHEDCRVDWLLYKNIMD